jgi:hypothetical protein
MEKTRVLSMEKKFELTHARMDSAHCSAPGLFRALKRGERKTTKLDITIQHGNDAIHFWGPEPLGADDLAVLQGLVAMAAKGGEHGKIQLDPESKTEIGQELRSGLELEGIPLVGENIIARGSITKLAHEMGLTHSGETLKTIRASIKRLFATSIFFEKDGKQIGTHLLSSYASDQKNETICIALNYRLTQAIIGGRYIRIDMDEARAVKADNAKLIHQRVCAFINPGTYDTVNLDTICGYLWPEKTTNQATARQHHKRAREALAELGELPNWEVIEYKRRKFYIRRPKISKDVDIEE